MITLCKIYSCNVVVRSVTVMILINKEIPIKKGGEDITSNSTTGRSRPN